jgi:ABC-type antimicrobial peptide transport system permease subunit
VQTGQLGMKLLVRTESNPDSVAPMLPRIVRGLDPNVQASITVLAEALKGWIWSSQVGALLSGGLGFLALLLATVGIYGVTSYSVAQRTHEIGIRVALGAKQSNVLWLVLGQGMTLVALGIGLGSLASVGVSHVLSGFLYGLSPLDPFTFAAVGVLFSAVAAVAIYAPARRAMKVDPMVALKYE